MRTGSAPPPRRCGSGGGAPVPEGAARRSGAERRRGGPGRRLAPGRMWRGGGGHVGFRPERPRGRVAGHREGGSSSLGGERPPGLWGPGKGQFQGGERGLGLGGAGSLTGAEHL